LNIITPISPEYQKLLKDNPEISDLKEFFSDYVQTILSEK
jgi:GTP1/Obg family GTP-binding protein